MTLKKTFFIAILCIAALAGVWYLCHNVEPIKTWAQPYVTPLDDLYNQNIQPIVPNFSDPKTIIASVGSVSAVGTGLYTVFKSKFSGAVQTVQQQFNTEKNQIIQQVSDTTAKLKEQTDLNDKLKAEIGFLKGKVSETEGKDRVIAQLQGQYAEVCRQLDAIRNPKPEPVRVA